MKNGNFIGLHNKVRFWLPRNRKYTELEALISHTLDIEENKSFSINGYAQLWGWSRNKVRNFLENIRSLKGHHRDRHKDSKGTSEGQGVVLKLNNLQTKKDIKRTGKGQVKGQLEDTTNNPNPLNPNPNKKNIYGEFKNVFLTDKEYQRLQDRFNSRCSEWIEKLSEGKARKGYKYDSDYLAILKWAGKEKNKDIRSYLNEENTDNIN